MKKPIKIILINLIILFLVILGFEIYFSTDYRIEKRTFFKYCYPTNYFDKYDYSKQYKKPPILFLGCSYTYGEKLEKEETFPYKVSQLSNRHCYNMAIPGTGLQYYFFELLLEEKYHKLAEKPEYIVYTYMFHHPARFYNYLFTNMYRKNGYIPIQKYNVLYNSAIYRHFKDIELGIWLSESFENQKNVFFSIMRDMKKQSEKLYPESKFIVLIYSDINYDLHKGIIGKNNENKAQVDKMFAFMNSKEFRQKLEDMGYIVISTEDLIGRKMDKKSDRIPRNIDPNYPHPTNEAWNEIAPAFVKKFNL